MRLERLAKDPGSGYGGSQTLYRDLDRPGMCVVQGLDDVPGEKMDSNPSHEHGVSIKEEILVAGLQALGYTVTR